MRLLEEVFACQVGLLAENAPRREVTPGTLHLEGRDKAYARSVLDPLMARWDALESGK